VCLVNLNISRDFTILGRVIKNMGRFLDVESSDR
jgi:hypothetical protein